MHRSTRHILKYQTDFKTYWLRELFDIYQAELNCYVEAMHLNEMPIRRFRPTNVTGVNISKSRWKNVIYKQSSQIIRGNGINNEVKPVLKNLTLELNQSLFTIEWKKSGEFDGFVRILLPFDREDKPWSKAISLPFKHHKQSLKYKKWTLLKTIHLKKVKDSYYLILNWQKEPKRLKKSGQSIGFDSGYRHLLADSKGNFHGSELKAIYEKLAQQKRGSKNYNRTLLYRDNKIGEVLNKIPIKKCKEISVEDLRNLKRGSKLSRTLNNKMQYWSYLKSTNKLESLCEEHGVRFTKVRSAYTSQCCPKCGFTSRSNRSGETFLCGKCEHSNHADIVGAINILNRGTYRPSTAKNNSVEPLKDYELNELERGE